MKTQTEIVLGLLSELTDVCRAEGIPCAAGGLVPQMLMKEKTLAMPLADLYIAEEHMSSLKEALNKELKKGRQIELQQTELGENLYYVNSDTTLIELEKAGERSCLGMYVRVSPYHRSGEKAVFYNAHGIRTEMDASRLEKTKAYRFFGQEIIAPEDLTSYTEILYYKDEKRRLPKYPEDRFVRSANAAYSAVLSRISEPEAVFRKLKEADERISSNMEKWRETKEVTEEAFERIRELFSEQ